MSLSEQRERANGLFRPVFDQGFRRVLSSSALMAGSSGISAAVGLVQVIVLTRLLGTKMYGQLVLLMGVTTTVRQLVGVRVWEWAMKDFAAAFVAKDPGAAAQVVRTGFRIGGAVNGLAFVIVALVSQLSARRLLHDPELTYLVLGFAVTLLVSWAYDTCFAVLRVAGRFRFLALHGAGSSLVRLILVGSTVYLWRRLDLAVLAYLILELVVATWIYLVASHVFKHELGVSWRRAPRVPKARSRRAMIKLLAIGGVIDTIKLLGTCLDNLVLGWFYNPAAVAVYQAAWNFIDGTNRLVNPISMVVFSDVAKLGASGDGQGILRLAKRLSLTAIACALPLGVVLFLLAPWLVNRVYGDAYTDAGPVLRILAFTPLWVTAIWLQPAHVSIGKPEWGLQVVGVISAVKLALVFALVPPFGSLGLASASLGYYGVYLALLPFAYLRIRRYVASAAFAAGASTPTAP